MGKYKQIHIQVRNDSKVIEAMWKNFSKEYPGHYRDIYGYLADIVITMRQEDE